MNLKARLAKLEKRIPPLTLPAAKDPANKIRLQRFKLLEQRLSRLITDALSLMTDEEKSAVEAALNQWRADQKGAYQRWFTDVINGHCRLPDLPASVMKTLLLTWLSPDVDSLGVPVCRHCGLEYPQPCLPPCHEWKMLPGKTPLQGDPPWYDLPEFFTSCPGCGASRFDIDWAHRTRDLRPPWLEMDDCMIRS